MESGLPFDMAYSATTPNGVAAPLHVMRMHRDTMSSWSLMPELLRRIERFCVDYDSDADAAFLVRLYMAQFTAEEPVYICGVFIEHGEVVGHFMAGLMYWCGTPAVTIMQFQADVPLPETLVAEGMDLIKEWAWERDPNINIFQALVSERKLIEHFRKWGFHTKYALMRHETS